MTDTVVFLLNGTVSWPDPGDTTATNNVQAIGAGGNGGVGTTRGGGGGGGGEWRKASNVAFSFPVTVAIAAGGSAADTTFAATTVVAKPGTNGSGATKGTGGTGGTGAAGNNNGGDGGTAGASSGVGSAGGGGAAGPTGIGRAGGNASSGSGSGGGGGGGSNGNLSTVGAAAAASGATAGAGGNGTGGTGGGTAGSGTGTVGGGGGGGTGSAGVGGPAGSDTAFDATHGCGGGGGGAAATAANGGAGGLYGGGGGGAAATHTAGSGANGIIVITYTPATGIAFDAASNSGYQAAASTYSWSHTCTGANRELVVGIAMLSLVQTVVSITYNGVALESVGFRASITGACRVELWALVAPATGSNTIAVTLSGAIASAGCAASYTGVNQFSPYEAFNSAQATNVGAADATVNVTTVADNDWVVDIVATDDTSITVGTGNTSRGNVTGAGGSGAMGDNNAAKTPAGSVTMSWTNIGALATWAIGAVALRPVAAATLSTGGFNPYYTNFLAMSGSGLNV